MINIAELLKDVPMGMKLYSPLFGEVMFKYITDSEFGIVVEDAKECYRSFDKYGRYFTKYNNAECLLFPSKDCRTWEVRKMPVEPKPHYDIANFHAGMPVLVRDNNNDDWTYTLFSHYNSRIEYKFVTSSDIFYQCIPFNNDTKHLLGTTDMPSEEYINW